MGYPMGGTGLYVRTQDLVKWVRCIIPAVCLGANGFVRGLDLRVARPSRMALPVGVGTLTGKRRHVRPDAPRLSGRENAPSPGTHLNGKGRVDPLGNWWLYAQTGDVNCRFTLFRSAAIMQGNSNEFE